MVVDKCRLKVKVSIPENKDDEGYDRVIFQSSIDVNRLFNGIHTNYFTRAIMEGYLKAIEFELKFPFKKVRLKRGLRINLCLNFNF